MPTVQLEDVTIAYDVYDSTAPEPDPGAETIVLLRLGGHEVLGRVAPDVRLQAGATARFALDTRKICLFDPATERLID